MYYPRNFALFHEERMKKYANLITKQVIGELNSLHHEVRLSNNEISLNPVKNCLFVFKILDEESEFEAIYNTFMKKEWAQMINCNTLMTNPENFKKYLDTIVKFMTVDYNLAQEHSLPSLASWDDSHWIDSLGIIFKNVDKTLRLCNTSAEMEELAEIMISFVRNIESIGYGMIDLHCLLERSRIKYEQLLIDEHSFSFEKYLSHDDGNRITINSREEFASLQKRYPYYKSEMEQRSFPFTYTFTEFVVKGFELLKKSIKLSIHYMEKLGTEESHIKHNVKKFVFTIFRNWSQILEDHSDMLLLKRLIQLSINLEYLHYSSVAYAKSKTFDENDLELSAEYDAIELSEGIFRNIRAKMEEEIGLAIRSQARDILQNLMPDWDLLVETPGTLITLSNVISLALERFKDLEDLPHDSRQKIRDETAIMIGDTLESLSSCRINSVIVVDSMKKCYRRKSIMSNSELGSLFLKSIMAFRNDTNAS